LAEKELDAILEKLCFCPNPSLHFCSRKSDKLALSAQVTAIAAFGRFRRFLSVHQMVTIVDNMQHVL